MRSILCPVILQVVILTTSLFLIGSAWSKETQQAQPLAGLDKILKQANGVKVDAIVDNRLASNVTNALNDMAQNLRKMFIENRRLTMQVQELVNRVQNATGVNATSALGNIQQQTSNISSLTNQMNLGSVMQRFNP